MNMNKYTIKAQEAVQEAVKRAERQGQQAIELAHPADQPGEHDIHALLNGHRLHRPVEVGALEAEDQTDFTG